MLTLFGHLLPQLVGIIIAPTSVIVAIVMLSTKRGIPNTLYMLAGGFTSFMAVGYFSHFLGDATTPDGRTPTWQGYFDLVVGILFTTLAILSFIQLRKKVPGEPVWLASLDKFRWFQAFAVGLYFGAFNPKSLALMMHVGQVTGASSVSFIESMLFLAFFSLMALTPIIVPLLITLLAGKTGQKILVKLRAFMTKHNYIILFVLLTVLAAVFLSKSAEILLGLP
jgi:hypothetical protein